MKIDHKTIDTATVMVLAGDLVAETADDFRKAAVSRFGESVCDFVLDMSAIELIDSKGLEALIWLQDECEERLGQLRLVSPRDHIRTILRLTRLASRFDTQENVDAAILSLR